MQCFWKINKLFYLNMIHKINYFNSNIITSIMILADTVDKLSPLRIVFRIQ